MCSHYHKGTLFKCLALALRVMIHALGKGRSFSAQLIMKHFMLCALAGLYDVCVVVFYGCETWSLTLREKRRLRVFGNRVLRKIFWPKRTK